VIRVATASLLAAACLLAAALSWELGEFAAPPPTPLVHPRTPNPAPTAVAPDRTAEWVSTILARPLLSPDRRPTATASADAGDRATPNGLPRLTAVLVGPFGRNAIFAADGSKPLVVTEGGRVNAWTIQTIDVGSVRVSGPGGALTLHPSLQTSSAVPDSAAAAEQHIRPQR
jgi:hypothetical protein